LTDARPRGKVARVSNLTQASPSPIAAIATFLMTDIEGSTRLWEEHPDTMPAVLEAHDTLLRASIEGAGGAVIKTTGDGVLARFEDPVAALEGALHGQRGLRPLVSSPVGPVRVRMGLHTGSAQAREGDFFGPALNRVARILAIGHGGQVLLSGVTAAVAGDRLPPEVTLLDRGEHRLRDLAQPEHVYQLAAPDLPREFPPLRSLGSSQTNLSIQSTTFVGREQELIDIRNLLRSSRLVTLIGTGGTGKTRLLLQVAVDLVDERRDGVWLVELAPIADPAMIAQEVARTLGVQAQPGATTLDSLIDFLRFKDVLLLLDNCEHVIGAAADLMHRLLAACPSLTVLATSREALGIAGETVFQVPSLAVPAGPSAAHVHAGGPAISFTEIASTDAVRLFSDRAMAVLPTFALTAENAPVVVEICRRLDGIPLAIELAAARVTLLSVEEILQRLGDRFRLLTSGRRTAVPRQQTLQALIDWSWDLLDERDRRLLRRLSVFAGGWTLDAAATVCAEADQDATDTLDALGRLVERSLVIVDRAATTRYRLLETIRQYARDRLIESGEADRLLAFHLAHFADLAGRAETKMRGPEMVEWLDRLDAETDNLRAAIEWSLEADPEAAGRLCVALWLYWRSRSIGLEGLGWLTEAAERLRALPLPADAAIRRDRDVTLAKLLAEAAFAGATWRSADMRPIADEAVVLARKTGDVEALVTALSASWTARFFMGEASGFRDAGDEVIRVAEPRQDWWSLAMAKASLASAIGSSDAANAEALLVAATHDARRTGNSFAIAFIALARARVLGYAGRIDEARPFFAEAFAAYTEILDMRFALVARSDLAHALRRAGQLHEAEPIYRETIHGWQHTGNRGAIANQLESFGFLGVERGDATRAARLFGAAEALREAAGSPMLSYERVDYDEAVGRLREALDPAGFAAAWAAGRRLEPEAAIAVALGD
jgi:predicted ATPase/class 3 adenylate cyclase